MTKNGHKLKFDVVQCVTSGDGFEAGCYYAQVGWNNGIGICLETQNGDCDVKVYQTGGAGRGLFNAWDDSGSPSFNPVWFTVNPDAIPSRIYRD